MAPRLEALVDGIPGIFMQCQNSLATHRKNIIHLAKIHSSTSDIWEDAPPRGIKLTGEKAFNDQFLNMVNRILPIKKGISNADRVVKLIGAFIMHISQKAAEEKERQHEENPDDEDDEDTPSSRLVAVLLKHLMKGFHAKDRVVRYRVMQIVAELIFSLGEMDEDLYTMLRASLLERARDKDSNVRLQAVIALARLQRGEEGSGDVPDDQENLTDFLIGVLQYDSMPEIRRAALVNLMPTPSSLPAILARTRDVDATLRKIVYHHVLAELPSPLVLTIAQREQVCQNGLGDRDPAVRAAAGNMIGGWVESVRGLEGFLKMLDITTSKVAEDALFSVFVTRPDIFESVEFPDSFWSDLTPERAFLARGFVDYCKSNKDETSLENALPVVTALAFRIQHEYNALTTLVGPDAGINDEDELEMARGDKEFIVAELLKLAVNLDYADETGRRKMFALVRDMASADSLPEGLITRCLDVLRVLSSSERDLFLMIVEIVHELRDTVKGPDETIRDREEVMEDGERSAADAHAAIKASVKAMEKLDPEQREQLEDINLRCLALCIAALERVNGTLEDHSALDGLLTDFVLTAIYQKHPVWRERGMTLLGLMCLISKPMAKKSAQLFLGQALPAAGRNSSHAHSEIQLRAVQMLFDIVMVFHFDGLEREGGPHDGESKILSAFEGALQDESSLEVHAAACEGMAKLMLSGIVTDENVLARLVGLYIDPATADNQPLRQCLSYFFPVYCYSSLSNQKRIQKIFVKVIEAMADLYDDLEEDEEMVSPLHIGTMLVDWTDSTKTVEFKGKGADPSVHVDVAIDIAKVLFRNDVDNVRKKVYAQLLSKLHVSDTIDEDRIRRLMLLLKSLHRRRFLKDTITRNAVARFETGLAKKFAPLLESFDEAQLRELEALKELFEFLDKLTSDEDVSDEAERAASESGRRRAGSKPPSNAESKQAQGDVDEDSVERSETSTRKLILRKHAKSQSVPNETDQSHHKDEEEAIEDDLVIN
ncbi:nuclear condensing complex subunit [Cantharellus anzutake]|uniref:nuclear condensing complex subunit n=1 Tax=Cantharellus anzutake TaxID=1750568 RepID=UPI0019058383|nr:nuclear condensing complex subunit [Cantharellus anzutake]KAF8342823.1 nuclear condensing complex subunit [Cantharellus anzutake]